MGRRIAAYLLLALLVALPFELYLRGRESSLATTLKFQLALFLLAWGWSAGRRLAGGIGRARLRSGDLPVPGRLLLAAAVLVAIQGVAALLAPDQGANARIAAVKWLLGAVVMVAAADVAREGDPRHGRRVLLALAASGTATALLGLGQQLGLGAAQRVVEWFQPTGYYVAGYRRLSATLEYPTTAASFLTATLLATLALLGEHGRGLLQRALPRAAAGLQLAALALTFSRGAALGLAAGLVAGLGLGERPVRRRAWVVAAAGGLVALAGLQYVAELAPTPSARAPSRDGAARIARFGLDGAAEVKRFAPGRWYRQRLSVRNDDVRSWRRDAFGVAYRWHDLGTGETSSLAEAAPFRADVGVGQEPEIDLDLQVPGAEGEYLLIWYVCHRDRQLVELEQAYAPAVVCSVRAAGALAPWSARALEALRLVRVERSMLPGSLVPGRIELWRAGLRMAAERPLFGIGPDNFRLLKSRYMDIPKGDETILANSLYVEVLSGSGLTGLAAFLWLLCELGRVLRERPATGPEAALTWFGVTFLVAYLTHGSLDYFLKFTPTFLLFWLLAGTLAARRAASREADARCL